MRCIIIIPTPFHPFSRSYFFTIDEITALFEANGFAPQHNVVYVNRRTINPKENLDVPRNFIQGKFIKKE